MELSTLQQLALVAGIVFSGYRLGRGVGDLAGLGGMDCKCDNSMALPTGCATSYTHQMKWLQSITLGIWVATVRGHSTAPSASA